MKIENGSGDFRSDLVVAEPYEIRMAQTGVWCPFEEFDRRHEFWSKSAASLDVAAVGSSATDLGSIQENSEMDNRISAGPLI